MKYAVNLVLGDEEPSKEELEKVRSAVALSTGASSTGLDKASIWPSIAAIIGGAAVAMLTDPEFINAATKFVMKITSNNDDY